MEVLFVALVIVAILIAAVSIGVARQALPGGNKPPPALPPAEHTVSHPEPEIRFRKRLPKRSAHFTKRVPKAPPQTKEMGPKPQGNGGAVKQKKVHLDFSLPCRVTGRTMLECGCQVCRDLRKKFGV